MNIGIYIYNQAEVLDFSGPFEVFSTASRICNEHPPFRTFLISKTTETVIARGGYQINPDFDFSNHPEIDTLIVSGGIYGDEMDKADVIRWIAQQAETATVVASVCTGAFLLAQAKVIHNHTVTTHWEDIDDLKNLFPNLEVVKDKRWVDDGRILTSAGISAGIDMSLHLVGKLHSTALAEKTAKQMDFKRTKN